jgi:signal transduction histidine kinase
MGLRGLSEMIMVNPKRAIEQAKQLEVLSSAGIDELQRLVTGLHPPQLDDLGLVAALRWYAGDITEHFGVKIDLNFIGVTPALPSDIRIVLFRIAQEAITNVIRHAGASKIILELVSAPERIILSVEDNGNGFDIEDVFNQGSGISHCWGLLGMQERASLVGGTFDISSYSKRGTRVEVSIPLVTEVQNA